MRKLTAIKLAIVSIVTCLILASCKKYDQVKLENTTSETSNDFEYLNSRLKKFVIGFAPVLSNQTAKKIIREKAQEKFDEEYEVLIKDLFNDDFVEQLGVSRTKVNELHNDLFKRSGEHVYPQIYIPSMQNQDDNVTNASTASLRTEDETEEPVYVFYSGDSQVDSAQG